MCALTKADCPPLRYVANRECEPSIFTSNNGAKAVVEIPTVQKLSSRFVKDETAATAIEYV